MRNILFGYRMEKGVFVINEDEAEYVRFIFDEYISGKSLLELAEYLTAEKVVYNEDNCKWNKSRISRLLDNIKYTGQGFYPKIISEEAYLTAKNIKEGKKSTVEYSDLTKYFNTVCYCGRCNAKFRRKGNWNRKERWFCSDKCPSYVYVDDEYIQIGIYNILKIITINTELLIKTPLSLYKPDITIQKEENEYERMSETSNINHNILLHKVIELAEYRYLYCYYDKAEITDIVVDEIKNLKINDVNSISDFKKYIQRVFIDTDGQISVEFINGAIITEKGAKINGTDNRKENNENPRKSIAS